MDMRNLISRRDIQALAIFFALSFVFFAFGIALGCLSYSILGYDMVSRIVKAIFQGVVVEDSASKTLLNIMLRNTEVTLILAASGAVFFAMPMLILFLNGFIAGLTVKMVLEKGVTLLRISGGLMPHAIFELPAVFIAAALGMKLNTEFMKILHDALFSKAEFSNYPGRNTLEKIIGAAYERTKKTCMAYFMIVLPLVITAALMETYVSAALIK